MPTRPINRIEHQQLEVLRREALTGLRAYERGEYTPLHTQAQLDAFFDEVAGDVGLKR